MGGRFAFVLTLALCAATSVRAEYGSCGDMNGDGRVDIADVTRLLRFTVGLETPQPEDVMAGDVAPASVLDEWQGLSFVGSAGDWTLNVNDVVLALRIAVRLTTIDRCAGSPVIESARIGTTCPDAGHLLTFAGRHLFEPVEVPRAWLGEAEATVVRTRVNDAGQDVLDVVTPALPAGQILHARIVGRGGLVTFPYALRVVADCASFAPRIIDVAPAWGVRGAETHVHLDGAALSCVRSLAAVGTTTGRILRAQGVLPLDDNSLEATLPAVLDQLDATFDLVVTTDCGEATLPAAWFSRDPGVPDAMTLAPSATVPADGGVLLLVRGTGLSTVTSIDFAGITLGPGPSGFVVGSDSELGVHVPPNPAGKFVTSPGLITVRSGASVDATPVPFTWEAVVLPTCTGLSPGTWYLSSSPVSVRIEGTELQRVTDVWFDGYPGTSLYYSPGSAYLQVQPPASIGQGTFRVDLVHDDIVEATCTQRFTWRP